MALNDDLGTTHACSLEDGVGRRGLYRRVKVQFRLFEYHHRSLGNTGEENEDGEHLRCTESHVGKQDFGRIGRAFDPHSVDIGILGYSLHVEGSNQLHLPKPLRHHVLDKEQLLGVPARF